MPFRICKTFTVESGHLLSKNAGNCRFPHGHSRTVEFVFEADVLDANDMVLDFKVVGTAVQEYTARLDHALCLNTSDPQYATLKELYGERIVGFEGEDPTTEVMARTLFEHARAQLAEHPAAGARVRLVRVRVWETSSTWAEYWT